MDKTATRTMKRWQAAYIATIPSREEIEKHVEDEMRRSKIFAISKGCEEEIWSLVYDEVLEGASGADKLRLEKFCDEWKIPEGSIACRNKVKVGTSYSPIQTTAKLTVIDKVLQCTTNAA
jgi:hypothetical protein